MSPISHLLMITAGTAIALPALAQTDSSSEQKKVRDPNQMVCEREEVLGSRLQGKRICQTRAQWAEQARLTREEVNHAQVQPCVKQGGC